MDDSGYRLVEKIEIVADDKECASIRPEKCEKPISRVGIEMIRRLIEQEKVTAGEENARQLQSPTLTTRESANGEVQSIRSKSQPIDQFSSLRFGCVPAIDLKALLGVGELRDVLLCGVFFHLLSKRLQTLRSEIESSARKNVSDGKRLRID
jgi:hypothetical protein